MLRALPPLVLSVFMFMPPVYADVIPPAPIAPKWLGYAVEVIVGETAAWLIGAELLWRLSRKKKQGVTRFESYIIMLVAMIFSFLVGLLFWKIFGWI
jgi:hypothetical protein